MFNLNENNLIPIKIHFLEVFKVLHIRGYRNGEQ